MKKLLMFLLSTSCAFGNVVQMNPLCEEEPRILKYRMLFLEGDIIDLENEIESIKESTDDFSYRKIKFLVNRMKYNIGYPIESKDLWFQNE